MDARTRLAKVRTNFLIEKPYFGECVLYLELVESTDKDGIPIAATDGYHLFYNKDFVNKAPFGDLEFVMLHETLHIALSHLVVKNKVPLLWNLATDCVINSILKKMGLRFSDEKSIIIANDKDEIRIGMDVVDNVSTRTSEYIYNLLTKNAISYGEGPDGSIFIEVPIPTSDTKSSGSGKGENKKDSDSGSGKTERKKFKGVDSHKKWNDREDADKKKDVTKIKEGLARGLTSAKQRGTLPEGIEEILTGIIEKKPELRWEEILEKEIIGIIPFDYTYKRPSRRQHIQDIILPGILKEPTYRGVVAIDTSGSMSTAELKRILEEIKALVETFPVKLTVVQCDAAVQAVNTIDFPEDLDKIKSVKGRGGTDFQPVFSWIDKNIPDCRVLVYFTDTLGNFPTKIPDYSVFWVTTWSEAKVPFGKIIPFIHEE